MNSELPTVVRNLLDHSAEYWRTRFIFLRAYGCERGFVELDTERHRDQKRRALDTLRMLRNEAPSAEEWSAAFRHWRNVCREHRSVADSMSLPST